jgi:CubicO group peptidase (beta-lactamase class C family)
VAAERPITVEDLLTFRSGIGFPSDFSYPVVDLIGGLVQQVPGQSVPAAGIEDWLGRLASVPLVHQPGAGWTYNTSADILGVVLARATGGGLPAVMRTRIFEPLGMADTGFAVASGSDGRLTDQWDATGQALVEPAASSEFLTEPAFPSGGGGLVSTVGDLHRFGRMLAGRGAVDGIRVLSAPSVDAMLTNHLSAAQRQSGALFLDGQGWGYCGSVDLGGPNPWNVAGRYGWIGGTGTAAHVIPASGTVAVLLTPAMLAGPTDSERFQRFWSYSTSG